MLFDSFRERTGFSKHNHGIDLLAEANGLFNGISLFPQLFKVLTTQSVNDLAPSTFFIMFLANIIWSAYGWHRRALPVIISSTLVMIASGTLLILFFLYRR